MYVHVQALKRSGVFMSVCVHAYVLCTRRERGEGEKEKERERERADA